MIRPVRKIYAPIDRIPPLYPPHPFADDPGASADASGYPKTKLSAAHPRRLPQASSLPPSYPSYTAHGLKFAPPPPKGLLLDERV